MQLCVALSKPTIRTIPNSSARGARRLGGCFSLAQHWFYFIFGVTEFYLSAESVAD